MALFRLDIEKERLGETWTNRYILSAPDLAVAVTEAANFWASERLMHHTSITFTRARVADMEVGTDVFEVIPIGALGLFESASPVLPLWNVARIDFRVASSRPSRKYFRVGLTAAMANGFLISTSWLDVLQEQADALAANEAYVDVDGEAITAGVAYANIAMRQLRRGSKRRDIPVLDRGP